MRAFMTMSLAVLASCVGDQFVATSDAGNSDAGEAEAPTSGADASTQDADASTQDADALTRDADVGTGDGDAAAANTDAPHDAGVDIAQPEGSGPTTVDLTPSKDAYVEDGPSVNTNFGAADQLRVKGNAAGMLDRNSWLSFDISGFASVSAAKLRIFVVSLDMGNTDPIPNQFFHAPTSSDGWSESTMTWSTAPAIGQEIAQTTVVDAQLATWVEVDVTPGLTTDSDSIATFVIESPQNTGRGLTYSSREGANKPILRVTGVLR
jgi:hypothetical protein